MNDRKPDTDEFGRDDPDSLEREARRREREEARASGIKPSRAQRKQAKEPKEPKRAKEPKQPKEPKAQKEPRAPRESRRMRRPRRPPPQEAAGEQAGVPRVQRTDQLAALRQRVSGGGRGRLGLYAAGLIVLIFLWLLFQPFHGDGSGEVVVTIPDGASAGQVADILDEEGVVTSGSLFSLRLRLSGHSGDIQAGNYTLAKGMSYGAAIDALTNAPVMTHVVLPEGLPRKQIAPIAQQAGVSGNYLKASAKSKALNPSKYGAPKGASLEGFLFPATYDLKPHSTVSDLVGQQVATFKQKIKGVNMSYAKKKNLTTFDVLTIASMVEREVQVAKERPLVAAVIYNRLHQSQPLGIDATTRFATGNFDKPLTKVQLNSDSPYNTRKFAGLPPGPIGNPGLASIQAAARPAKVGYLFYVVKPGTCGEHAFAKTLSQFNKLVAQYDAARAKAGGNSPTTCPSG